MNTIATEHVVIRSIAVSEMENNVYLITAKETGSQVLIDAADDIEAISGLVAAGAADTEAQPELRAIITTHRHWDHIRALPAASAKYPDAMTIAGSEDAAAIAEAEGVEIAHRVDHLDVGDFGGFVLQAIGLRGHTPGSVALLLRDGGHTILFAGDSLFPGGPGKTWSRDDFTSLMDDLEERVFAALPDDTLVLPGHGASTTLGDERPKLGSGANAAGDFHLPVLPRPVARSAGQRCYSHYGPGRGEEAHDDDAEVPPRLDRALPARVGQLFIAET